MLTAGYFLIHQNQQRHLNILTMALHLVHLVIQVQQKLDIHLQGDTQEMIVQELKLH